MKLAVLSSITAFILSVSAQNVYTNCSGNHEASYCAGPSLNTSTILRCSESSNDTPQPGNCADNLADYGGEGPSGAYCWQTSNTTGDAQCTTNCVRVTAANGTSFYPLGCTSGNSTSGNQTVANGAPSSTVLSPSGESSSIDSATGAPSSISLSTAGSTVNPSLVASASTGSPSSATGSSVRTSAYLNNGLLGSLGICSAMCGLGMLLLM